MPVIDEASAINVVEAYYEKAQHALAIERPKIAIEQIQQIFRIEGETALGYYILARAFLMLNQPETAKQHLVRAIQIDPECVQAFILQAGLFEAEKKFRNAEESYLAAIRLAPNYAPIHRLYSGLLLDHLKQLPLAEQHGQTALSLDPQDEDNAVHMAWIMAEKKEWALAEHFFKQALSINPDSFTAHHDYGLFLLKDRNAPCDAYVFLSEAIRQQPNNPQALTNFKLTLKAKHRWYAVVWNIGFYIQKLGPFKWPVVVSTYMFMKAYMRWLYKLPEWAWLKPVVFLYVILGVYMLLADPIFDFLIKKRILR